MIDVQARLEEHLRSWLSAWPPKEAFAVVGGEARTRPGWDGAIHAVIGVQSPGGTIVSLAPAVAEAIGPVASEAELRRALGPELGTPGRIIHGTFRWSEEPTALEEAGLWLPADDPRVPQWLRPFGGEVLVVLDGDQYVAGVGIKRHDAFGKEIAVGTEDAARGRGLARKLVARAARRIIDEGGVPTYLHDVTNIASAHVAEAAGFPDRGWKFVGFELG